MVEMTLVQGTRKTEGKPTLRRGNKHVTPKCSRQNLFGYVPMPENCPCCNGRKTVSLLTRDQFGGKWAYDKMAYRCHACGAMVGASDAGEAMGVLATEETRKLRIEAHKCFDKLWMKGPSKKFNSRSLAYRTLARKIEVEYEDCHFANMDEYTLKAIIKMLKENKV